MTKSIPVRIVATLPPQKFRTPKLHSNSPVPELVHFNRLRLEQKSPAPTGSGSTTLVLGILLKAAPLSGSVSCCRGDGYGQPAWRRPSPQHGEHCPGPQRDVIRSLDIRTRVGNNIYKFIAWLAKFL